jgi:VanZ family protein
MTRSSDRSSRQIALTVPVIALVLAFTAVPMELKPPAEGVSEMLDVGLDVPDIVQNVVGYLPIGVVLAPLSAGIVAGVSAAVSGLAEASQVFTRERTPSPIDLATNIIGAMVGWGLCRRRGIRFLKIPIERRGAAVAAVLAAAYVSFGARVTPSGVEDAVETFIAVRSVAQVPVNFRGATAPGRLEAHWTFDEGTDDRVVDASGSGLNGTLVNGPTRVAGVSGLALRLNGTNQYVTFGNPSALRLAGSMTVSAWVNASSFPRDDAAIVSDDRGFGYQLDTTVDQGPRTIGFKLSDASGRLMARYGTTPLETGVWYHVAGVYDAGGRTLDVYLNGHLDNGCLLGTVTDRQTVTGGAVHVGRRASRGAFQFTGAVDEVRIYSRALAAHEIAALVKGTPPVHSAARPAARGLDTAPTPVGPETACHPSEPPDARTSGFVVAFGFLVAFASAGFWPTKAYRIPCLILGFTAGFLLAPAMAGTLPAYYLSVVPLLTLAGAMTVAVSARDVGTGRANKGKRDLRLA